MKSQKKRKSWSNLKRNFGEGFLVDKVMDRLKGVLPERNRKCVSLAINPIKLPAKTWVQVSPGSASRGPANVCHSSFLGILGAGTFSGRTFQARWRPSGTPAPSWFWVLWILYKDVSLPLASWFCPTFKPICPGTFILPLLHIRGHLPDVSRLCCFGLSLHLHGCGVGSGGLMVGLLGCNASLLSWS